MKPFLGNGDLINTDPLLGLLQDNGGSTYSRALLPGSPAINAGGSSTGITTSGDLPTTGRRTWAH